MILTYAEALTALDGGQFVRIAVWPAGQYVKENLPATSPKTYQLYDPNPRFGRPHWRNYVMVDDGSTWETYVP